MKNLLPFLMASCLCVSLFYCEQPAPPPPPIPDGLFPEAGKALTKAEAENLVLSWDAVRFRDNRPLKYQVSIFELETTGDSTARSKTSTTTYKKIYDEQIETSYLRYASSGGPKLKDGQVYAWEVEIVDNKGHAVVIKDFNPFIVGQVNRGPVNPSLSWCEECWYLYPDCSTKKCSTIICSDDGVVHVATGGVGPSGSGGSGGGRSVHLGSSYNPACPDLISRDADGTIHLTGKYVITVPDGSFNLISEDQVIVKVFKDGVDELTGSDISVGNYQVFTNKPPSTLVEPFIVKKANYEDVCIGGQPYKQAVVHFDISFKVELSMTPYFSMPFPKNYDIIFDLVASPNGTGTHSHGTNSVGHTYTTGITGPCQKCVGKNYGTFDYYKCYDDYETYADCHQGLHIVRIPIRRQMICGPWNAITPVVDINGTPVILGGYGLAD